MTATMPPADQRRASTTRRPSSPAPGASTGVRRTLMALVASGLGVIPLKGLFSDYGWLIDVWLTMVVVLGPAMLLRRRRPPGALDIWPGIILLVPWLTLRFVREHAFADVVPTRGTWHDVSRLLSALHRTTHDDVAPIHTTIAVRLVVCALLGLVAALIDLIAVVGRRGALAGVPLLVIYTVAGAVPRAPVSWVWFAFAATGYLVLLGLDAGEDLQSWGRRIRPREHSRSGSAMSATTSRIAVAAVVVAIALPLLVPGQSRNLIANAFHGEGGGGDGVAGFGGANVGSITPFAALKGQLDMPTPVDLMKVHVSGGGSTQPFYVRSNVLEDFTGNGWAVASHGPSVGIEGTDYPTQPAASEVEDTVQMTATVSLTGALHSNAPIFAVPTHIDGLSSGTDWSPQDQILVGDEVDGKGQYTETYRQPEPTTRQLAAATETSDDPQLRPLLALPSDLPAYVTNLVARLTRSKSTPYAKARAINSYFTNPDKGFFYNLQTKQGDSGSELVDFLKNKQGFCQQFAAAEAVMLREAGVPSRVVLGYMHPEPDSKGDFTINTSDAHSWVEAYFAGVGWIPFDPTPISGLAGGAKSDLPWAPHSYGSTGKSSQEPTLSRQSSHPVTQPSAAAPSKAAAAPVVDSRPPSAAPLWWSVGLIALIGLVLVPAATRRWRRERRLRTARRSGDTDALWAELSDTAIDLGYSWSSARSPRQVAMWLGRDAPATSSRLHGLAVAVEHGRYSAGRMTGDAAALSDDLRAVLGELRAYRSSRTRLRATMWPASLGWSRPLGRRGQRSAVTPAVS